VGAEAGNARVKGIGRRRAELPEAPNLLAIETGLVGELLVITPALRAIKKSYPLAKTTVMVSPASAPVLVGNPHVDRLLALSKKERGGAGGFLRLSTWIRSQRFDAALVFHTSFRSAILSALGGVPIRAGLSTEGRGFALTHRAARDRSAYEVGEHLKVLGTLGIAADGSELELHLTSEEREEARDALAGVASGSTLVGLHPGASREIRRWPVERFAEVAAVLSKESGAAPVFFFGPKEQNLKDAVQGWYAGHGLEDPVIISPRNIRLLGAFFERMNVVVTNNTGPMHVAAAVGVPGVFIHGPTPVGRWHPPGDRHTALFARDVECRPCDSPRCRIDRLACMESVSVDEVVAAIRRHMAA
jgi:heptosyltransferase-2